MISRRNIRVKVMQTLYNITTLESNIKPGEPQKILQNHFDQTRQLFVHLTYFLTEVCRYAETDAHQRAGKHLPSFEEALTKTKPQLIISKDLVRRTYLRLAETPEYKTYISKQGRDSKEEKEILEFVLDKLLLADENFTSYIEENFSNWDDDGEMVIQLLVNLLQKPGSMDFKEMIIG